MSNPNDVAILGGIFVASQLILPFYNTFLKKQELIKDQNDQFHSRDNNALEEISALKERVCGLENYNQGLKDGKAEVRAELKQK
jgi:uncharacterized protein (DUF2164 family)